MIIPLTGLQKKIMKDFYSVPHTKVVYNKSQREKLWNKSVARSTELDFNSIKEKCPALEHQIKRSYSSGNNIQSAVFSECVYAQTFANIMNLTKFVNCYDEGESFIPQHVKALISSYYLSPRYVYSTEDKTRMLIQAGGCDGIDSALITVVDLVIYTIEFKEPGAKTSEPDLPKYKEDGKLIVTKDWLNNYPQFEEMLKEQADLNFFAVMGNNAHDFSSESVNIAVTNNYSNKKKYADVICTEDIDGNLVMLPTNQVSQWAMIEGEIRPAGRNHYKVWTPNALSKFLLEKGAIVNGDIVTIDKKHVTERKARGGNKKVTGYKINPLFFVYCEDCVENNGVLTFKLSAVRQLNPTIAGKMYFSNLKYKDVKAYYAM